MKKICPFTVQYSDHGLCDKRMWFFCHVKATVCREINFVFPISFGGYNTTVQRNPSQYRKIDITPSYATNETQNSNEAHTPNRIDYFLFTFVARKILH